MPAEYRYKIERIIARALRICGKYANNEDVLPEDYQIGVENLNSLLHDWVNEGFQPAFLKTININIISDINIVTLQKNIVNILDCFLKIGSDGNTKTLDIITYDNFLALSVDEKKGEPSAVAFENNKLHIYPIPAYDYEAVLNCSMFVDEINSADDVILISPNYYEALVYGLATKFADELMLPVNDKLLFEKRAMSFFQKASASRVMNERVVNIMPNGGIV